MVFLNMFIHYVRQHMYYKYTPFVTGLGQNGVTAHILQHAHWCNLMSRILRVALIFGNMRQGNFRSIFVDFRHFLGFLGKLNYLEAHSIRYCRMLYSHELFLIATNGNNFFLSNFQVKCVTDLLWHTMKHCRSLTPHARTFHRFQYI